MSALPQPACPACRAVLALEHDHAFDAWGCPEGHGLAFTLSEAYERLRDEEIHAIWQRARAGDPTPSARGCPMCERTMVAVPCGAVTLDVCLVDEVFWFDAGELEQLPPDVPDAPPTDEEQAALDRITDEFGDALDAGWDAEEAATLTGRLADRLLRARRTTPSISTSTSTSTP